VSVAAARGRGRWETADREPVCRMGPVAVADDRRRAWGRPTGEGRSGMARVVRPRAGADGSPSRTSDPHGTDSSHSAPRPVGRRRPNPSPWRCGRRRLSGYRPPCFHSVPAVVVVVLVVLVLLESAYGQRVERAPHWGRRGTRRWRRRSRVPLVTGIEAGGWMDCRAAPPKVRANLAVGCGSSRTTFFGLGIACSFGRIGLTTDGWSR
jgi:hypothetical protein